MKFSCDSCNAQYMIADEKVGDRGVKVKCKKCAHVIIVKPLAADSDSDSDSAGSDGNGASDNVHEDTGAAGGRKEMGGAFDSLFGGGAGFGGGGGGDGDGWDSFGSGDTAAAAAASAQAQSEMPAGEKEWYVAVEETQVGPIDIAEIQQRWDARELNEDSLAWKAGMADWNPIAEIPELAYLVTERPHNVSHAASAGAVQSSVGAATGLAASAVGGSQALGPVAFAGAGAGAPQIDWKPSAASALSSLVEEELAAPPEAPAAPERQPERPAGVPDLGGMPGFGASDLFGSGGANGSAAAGGSFGTQAPPIEGGGWSVPQTRRRPTGGVQPLHIVLGVTGLVAVLGLLGMVFYLVTRTPAPPQLAQAPQQVAAAAPAPEAAAAPAAQPEAAKAAKAEPSADARPSQDDTSAKSAGSSSSSSKSSKRERKSSRRESAASPAPPPKREAKREAPASAAGPLSKDDIIGTVKNNASSIAPCLKQAKSRNEIVPGRYKFILDWTIRPNGSVGNVRLTGPPNVLGTSLPGCFERVIGGWRFPASSGGAPISNFPFGPITVR